jgi:hypothetical protein
MVTTDDKHYYFQDKKAIADCNGLIFFSLDNPQSPDRLRLPPIKDSRNSTIKMKNKTLAMEAAPAAMPKNPKIPAMIAMIKKIIVQRNISLHFR